MWIRFEKRSRKGNGWQQKRGSLKKEMSHFPRHPAIPPEVNGIWMVYFWGPNAFLGCVCMSRVLKPSSFFCPAVISLFLFWFGSMCILSYPFRTQSDFHSLGKSLVVPFPLQPPWNLVEFFSNSLAGGFGDM